MKKVLLLLFFVILFSCEKQYPCYQCEIIKTMKLSNKAYSWDTIVIDNPLGFVFCNKSEAELSQWMINQRDEGIISHIELPGTVYYWEGVYSTYAKCKLKQ